MYPVPSNLQTAYTILKEAGAKVALPFSLELSFTPAISPRVGLALDLETTGLDADGAKIIEVAMILFEFCTQTGKLSKIIAQESALEDPGCTIPKGSFQVHGITPEMLKGKSLPDEKFTALIQQADLVMSHHAGFDREFIEKRYPELKEKSWACTLQDVPWREEGFKQRSLEQLCLAQGFYFDGHRALDDTLALLQLLQLPLPSGKLPLLYLQEESLRKNIRLWASGANKSHKGELRNGGYYWKPNFRYGMWGKEMKARDYLEEKEYLKRVVHKGDESARVIYEELSAKNKYTLRSDLQRETLLKNLP